MNDLQRLIERLAEQLNRSVAIDDVHDRLLTYSPHYGAVDEQRLASILHRRGNPEAVEWGRQFGVHQATGYVRVPKNPDRGILSRICVPIRSQGLHLGYLFIIDAEESMTADEIESAIQAAQQAAAILHRQSLFDNLERARERELLRDALDLDVEVRRGAIGSLVEESLFDVERPVVALILDITGPAGATDRTAAAEIALAQARRLAPLRQSLYLVRQNYAILVITADRTLPPTDTAARMRAEYWRALGRTGQPTGVRVGVGNQVSSIAELPVTYARARSAVEMGRRLGLDRVVPWEDLGVYRVLSELPLSRLNADSLHPALAHLAEDPDGEQLLETLEVYLDNGGDATVSAEKLFLHRSTLYHRLSRIERIGEVSVKRGTNLLDLHVSLKLLRILETEGPEMSS